MLYDLKLRPMHYASVSGGKDSLYMLGLILQNQDKYPLDLVVNFDLEIDWQVAKDVVSEMEKRCNQAGIPFIRIKPRKSWKELYDKYGFPNGVARWCNSEYKLDCKKQLNEWIKSQNCRPVAYIGFCADETKRFKYEVHKENWELQDCCYPLAEEGIEESTILEWAKKNPLFKGYYDNLPRMGCMLCPYLTMRELVYLKESEPKNFEKYFELIKNTEEKILREKGKVWKFRKVGGDAIKDRVLNKWIPKIQLEKSQISIFDIIS